MSTQNPTPDATPRICSRCGSPDPDEDHVFNADGCVGALKRELAEKKTEIARLSNLGWFSKYHAEKARAERAEAELQRWQEQLSLETDNGPTGDLMATSRAWQKVRQERDQLRARVVELEQALADYATKAAAEYGEQLKPLFAKVRELEQDKARMAVARGFIKEYLALGGLFNPEAMEHNKVRDLLMDIADIIDGNQLSPNGLVAKRQAAIDAARAGKERT